MSDKKITDGVYGFVSGTVGREFTTQKGRAFEIEVKQERQQYGDKWTVWADLPVSQGDRVTVKGWLSSKAETYTNDGETKAVTRRGVNSPEIVAHETSNPAGAPDDQWAYPRNDETPF